MNQVVAQDLRNVVLSKIYTFKQNPYQNMLDYQQVENYLIPHANVVLDIGCGTGILGKNLQAVRPTLDILGCDVAPALRYTADYFTFAQADACIPSIYPEKTFDSVIAFRVLHEARDQRAMLKNCFSWAKKQVLVGLQLSGIDWVTLLDNNEYQIANFLSMRQFEEMAAPIANQAGFELNCKVAFRPSLILYEFRTLNEEPQHTGHNMIMYNQFIDSVTRMSAAEMSTEIMSSDNIMSCRIHVQQKE